MRIRIHRLVVVWLVLLASSSVAHQLEPLSVQMGSALFEQAGLDSLSAAELDVLAAWLHRREHGPAGEVLGPGAVLTEQGGKDVAFKKEPLPVARVGAEQLSQVAEKPLRIEARIKGEFTGWEGKTLFYLDNGQVWRQRVGSRYRRKLTAPAIVIEKGRFGYYLELLDTGKKVGVRRVK